MERATTVEADANGVGQWDILEMEHWLYVLRMGGCQESHTQEPNLL
jgi:hypothetical protein